jgi:hypothetical protein
MSDRWGLTRLPRRLPEVGAARLASYALVSGD